MRRALHVPEYVPKYEDPTRKVQQNYKAVMESSSWIYDLMDLYGYRMLHLLGDTDGIVSLAGAWGWIRKRKFKVTRPWTPWLSKNGELTGFVKEYTHLSFVTVHGYGHGGAMEKKDESPDLILRFAHEKPLI